MKLSSHSFCEKLADKIPEAQAILRVHLNEFDTLLPNVFLAEITRYVLSGGIARERIVEFFENNFHNLGDEVENLIAVSFVENIETAKELNFATNGVDATRIITEWHRQKGQ
ncbi:MAG: hypothetical protein FJ308_06315 [Planctomycetes bacterium]|nr:hypothetical protein [Planctomycetota bacterium]